MASTYLKRTLSGTPSTYTFSAWIKLGKIIDGNGQYQSIFSNGTQQLLGLFSGSDATYHNALYHYNGSSSWYTNNLLKDPCSWYHVLLKVSSGTATTYINGVQTSYATSASLGALVTTTDKLTIGCYADNTDSFFTGSMSHVHFCDGTAYNPTEFGETDATTGEWKIKTSVSVSYGTDGFFILKDGNSVTDQSGNGNNFTVGGGTLTQTADCPSNVFATINSLDNLYIGGTLSNGNNKIVTGVSQEPVYINSTLGASSGKYYCEVKNLSPQGRGYTIGISGRFCSSSNDSLGSDLDGFGYIQTGAYRNNNTETSYGNSYTENDIIGIALDLDNNKLYFSKNGTWQNSGDPTSGATGTGAISIGTPSTGFYFISLGDNSGNTTTFETNFGNGYFGTTAVSSNSGNGYSATGSLGIFQYQPPTGYTALSTKGLNL